MKRLAVINVVGLTQSVLETSTHMKAFAARGARVSIAPAFPAVTCTAQSTYLTGLTPAQHGIVGNGWYDRTLSEVQFWKQSNKLVAGAKVWEDLRREIPGFTCAKIFWWYNMYSSADFSLTPRPMYPADGRKVFDIYTHPASIRTEIKKELGEFPFPSFWGPLAGIKSSQWIAESAKWIERRHQPTMNLIYLPHLDYNLQRLGPNHPDIANDIAKIDAVVGDLISFFSKQFVEVVLLSEYGITEVNQPIHLNRLFRDAVLGKQHDLDRLLVEERNQVAHHRVNLCDVFRDVGMIWAEPLQVVIEVWQIDQIQRRLMATLDPLG